MSNVTIDKIKFRNMESRRIGRGIRELRRQNKLSLEQFAQMANIPPDYLDRLEEGYEPEVDKEVLERILETARIRRRGKCTEESLKNIFLGVCPSNPPEKLL